MNTARELQTARPRTHLGTNRLHPRERTGVRFVLTNATDPSLETHSDDGDLTGVHIILSDSGTDTVREQRAAALLKTGFFHAASRSRIIEGNPEPRHGSRSLRPVCKTR
jgi:hypothetical protein